MEGSHGDTCLGYRLKISILLLIKNELSASDPVIFLPPWIGLLDDAASIMNPPSLTGDLIGFDFLLIEVRDIDIEEGILRESMFDHMLGHPHRKPCRRIKFKMTPRDQGDGKGRNAQ